MKKHLPLFIALFLNVCCLTAQTVIEISGNISSSTTWTSNNIYLLKTTNCVFVTNNATLTIEPGTVIKGETQSALLITRGAKIIAEGTAERPIVFTSAMPAGVRQLGDWGGLLIAGNAPINSPGGAAFFEGGCDQVLGAYGGTDPADNSGILRYVRIEFAGYPFQPNNELNSLTMGGVGNGTILEHVMVSYGNDDGFEWFGGTVNGKWLVCNKTLDDMFDTDFGYSGKNQWVLGISNPSTADVSGSNGFESDNDAGGSTNGPKTDATFTNVSIFGPKQDAATTINTLYRRSMHIRRCSYQDIFNSVFTGFNHGLRIESACSVDAYLNGTDVKLKNNVIAGMAVNTIDSANTSYQAIIAKFISENTVLPNAADVMAADPFHATQPNFMPMSGSPTLSGADFTDAKLTDAFFTPTTYRGAFGDTDWTKCWTEWDPINADYSTVPLVYITKPAITAGGATTFCAGNNVTLSAAAGFSYAWSNGATTETVTADATGTFSVTVTNSRGCSMSSDPVSVTVNPNPTANFTFAVNGSDVFFTNTSSGANTYSWSFGDSGTSTAASPSHTYAASGTYTVCLTANTTPGCTNQTCQTIAGVAAPSVLIVDADITANTTWTPNNIYVLQGGCIFVRNNTTLTIEPGTIIRGNAAALVITQGSKLIADGTKDRPIVFTSNKPAGQRVPGDWGGILLAGKAPINVPGGTAFFEGGCDPVLGLYGGTDAADNSGILRYVRIEFAGIPFQPNNELNSLTMGGVGSGTVIEHVQCSYGGDDGFEWFGGTVNGKWIINYRTVDDMFDTDFGYNGKNQWVLGVSDPNIADVSGSNAFESDNDAGGSTNGPKTDATFTNVSIFGPKQTPNTVIASNFRRSMHIRRCSYLDIFNSVFTGFNHGLRLESSCSVDGYLTGNEVRLKNNVVAGMVVNPIDSANTSYQAIIAKFIAENTVLPTVAGVLVDDPFNATDPDYLPLNGSPLLSGADFSDSKLTDAFFTPTTYRGAFGTTDWTECWAEWDPINANYTNSIDYRLNPGISYSNTENDYAFTGTTTNAVSYIWDFGDGSPASTLENPTHAYAGTGGDFTVTLTVTSSRGCSATATTNLFVTDAKEVAGLGQVKVFPNPFRNLTTVEFTLENQMELSIELLDVTGKVMGMESREFAAGVNHHEVDGSNLAAGIYFLRLLSAEGQHTMLISVLK